MNLKIIRCIHKGEKTRIKVAYEDVEKVLSACTDCIEIIEGSNICKILERLD